MDVTFETSKGRLFTIEIGYFDTVHEIKEKIHKYEGYPVSSQKLIFNGRELSDDGNTEHYDILQGSHIHLAVNEPAEVEHHVKEEDATTPVNVVVLISVSKRRLSLQVDAEETVGRLKERIFDAEGIPVNRLVLFYGSIEMQDHRTLADYGVRERIEVSVVVRPLVSTPTSLSKKLKVMVVPKCSTKKIPVEVNASDNVGELRKELQKLQGQLDFDLPTEGFFFIYKQNVMDDDRSFRWHDVRQGDTIEIFNGSVTGGS
ncbi:polyubiquitin-like [Typha latifolia]|uniref:polyubiquitin-like n=1 Tax=Typha latifolia TaxID=4733 RepID=UPI003C2F6358